MTERLINRKNFMPRTKEQNDQIRAKTRSMILNCSLELFADKGFNGTSMSDIAERVGVSKGLAYSYFKSKQEILEILIEDFILEKFFIVEEFISELELKKTAFDKLILIVDRSFDLIINSEKIFRLYLRLLLQPGILESTQKKINNFHNRIAVILVEYKKIFTELGCQDPITEVYFFSAIINGVFLEYLSHGKEYPLEKVKEAIKKRYSVQS
jgi:AcrR family transcriptional regulator